SEDERRNTAYHESGHAVVAKLLPKSDPVHKVTIIPRGRALGVTMQLPEQDRYAYDRDYLLNRIAVLFGGRVAEEVFMKQMTTNVSSSTLLKIENEIRRIIDEQYGLARKLIEDNHDKVDAMARALLELETIDADQIDDIMAGRPPRPPRTGGAGAQAGQAAAP